MFYRYEVTDSLPKKRLSVVFFLFFRLNHINQRTITFWIMLTHNKRFIIIWIIYNTCFFVKVFLATMNTVNFCIHCKIFFIIFNNFWLCKIKCFVAMSTKYVGRFSKNPIWIILIWKIDKTVTPSTWWNAQMLPVQWTGKETGCIIFYTLNL